MSHQGEAAARTAWGLLGTSTSRSLGPLDVDREIRRGLPIRTLLRFKRHTGLSFEEIASVLDVSTKTIERTIARAARLSTAASDRLYRMARLVALAEQVLEKRDVAREWLHSPQHGLGGRVPFDLLSSEAGAREVESLLERIEHGFLA
jgi:putative toxin-antitoxin system antitoxin component (TIGR02293 family)